MEIENSITTTISTHFLALEGFLKGKALDVASLTQALQIIPKSNLTTFVSSTFTDTHKERNILHEKILPRLQAIARQHNISVILYDMRFGIKDESSLDHLTWISCRDAIQQCFEANNSDMLFFLSLQSAKYGYMPLPKYLDATAFQAIMEKAGSFNAEHLQILQEWYRLDENCLPPRYELKNLPAISNNEETKYREQAENQYFWQTVLPTLRDHVLDGVCFEYLSDSLDHKHSEVNLFVNRSITEWETLYALEKNRTGCAWVKRMFHTPNKDLLPEYPRLAWLIDTLDHPSNASKLKNLIDVLEASLSTIDRVIRDFPVIAPITYLSDDNSEPLYQEYLVKWESQIENLFLREVQKLIERQEQWRAQIALHFHLTVEDFEEIFHHQKMMVTKQANLFGRDEFIELAFTMMQQNKRQYHQQQIEDSERDLDHVHPDFSGVLLALIGSSGVGKTSLMAKLASVASQIFSSSHVIVRFCGSSHRSYHAIDLIRSICIQILYLTANSDGIELKIQQINEEDDYKKLLEEFQQFLKNFPIVLLIDSLDQLSDRHNVRSTLNFLKAIELHEHSYVIISSIDYPLEESVSSSIASSSYTVKSLLQENKVSCLEVSSLSTEDGSLESCLKQLLALRSRTLTADQWQSVQIAVSQEPSVLYMSLAVEILVKQRSFSSSSVNLQPTVKGVIFQIFEDLEVFYGKHFVSFAFAFITFSRVGMSDLEIADCLSHQPEVMKEIFQYSSIAVFPMHVWLRLKFAVKNLVSEKDSNCIKWYHRQLFEVSALRYQEIQERCCETMGSYFTNTMRDKNSKKSGQAQALSLNEIPVWFPAAKINRRRVLEGYHHLVKVKKYSEAIEEICSLEFVCASILMDDAYNLLVSMKTILDYFNQSTPLALQHRYSNYKALQGKIRNYYDWLKRNITVLTVNPRQLISPTAMQEVKESILHSDLTVIYQRYPKTVKLFQSNINADQLNTVGEQSLVWTRESVFYNHPKGKGFSFNLNRHCKEVTGIQYSKDGRRLLSGSKDQTMLIWDTDTAAVIKTIEAGKPLTCVKWNHAESLMVAGAENTVIMVWNAVSGHLLFEGKVNPAPRDDKPLLVETSPARKHSSPSIRKIAFSGNDAYLALINDNKDSVVIWDPATFHSVVTIHETIAKKDNGLVRANMFYDLDWSPDNQRLVTSGLYDVQIWEIPSGRLLQRLDVPSSCSSIAWSPDGSMLIGSLFLEDYLILWRDNPTSPEYSSSSVSPSLSLSSSFVTFKIVPTKRQLTDFCWNAAGSKVLAASDGSRTVFVLDIQAAPDTPSIINKRNSDYTTKGKKARRELFREQWRYCPDFEVFGQISSLHWNQVVSAASSTTRSQIVVGVDDGSIEVWEGDPRKNHASIASEPIRKVVFGSSGKKVLIGSAQVKHDVVDESQVSLWDLITHKVTCKVSFDGFLKGLALNRQETKIFVTQLGSVKIYDVASGDCVFTNNLYEGEACMALNSSDSLLAVLSFEAQIEVLAVDDQTLEKHSDGANSLWNCVCCCCCLCWCCGLAYTKESKLTIHHKSIKKIGDMCWSPRDEYLIILDRTESKDSKIHLLNPSSGAIVQTLADPQSLCSNIRSIAVTPSLTAEHFQIAAASSDRVFLWNNSIRSTGQSTAPPIVMDTQGESYGLRGVDLVYSSDGKRLLYLNSDSNLLIVYDSVSGRVIHRYQRAHDKMTCVSWSEDQLKIITGTEEGGVMMWDAVSFVVAGEKK